MQLKNSWFSIRIFVGRQRKRARARERDTRRWTGKIVWQKVHEWHLWKATASNAFVPRKPRSHRLRNVLRAHRNIKWNFPLVAAEYSDRESLHFIHCILMNTLAIKVRARTMLRRWHNITFHRTLRMDFSRTIAFRVRYTYTCMALFSLCARHRHGRRAYRYTAHIMRHVFRYDDKIGSVNIIFFFVHSVLHYYSWAHHSRLYHRRHVKCFSFVRLSLSQFFLSHCLTAPRWRFAFYLHAHCPCHWPCTEAISIEIIIFQRHKSTISQYNWIRNFCALMNR